ncbi:hypothetical protein HYX00_00100 [Candidatus Woesearchaeota archaeon]|nr:hypothetical protein [Candidatus Woesearchaeota archaeon]
MIEKQKPQIPLEDRTLLDNLILDVMMHDDRRALEEVTEILAKYTREGFSTVVYALKLLKYYESKRRCVLYDHPT